MKRIIIIFLVFILTGSYIFCISKDNYFYREIDRSTISIEIIEKERSIRNNVYFGILLFGTLIHESSEFYSILEKHDINEIMLGFNLGIEKISLNFDLTYFRSNFVRSASTTEISDLSGKICLFSTLEIGMQLVYDLMDNENTDPYYFNFYADIINFSFIKKLFKKNLKLEIQNFFGRRSLTLFDISEMKSINLFNLNNGEVGYISNSIYTSLPFIEYVKIDNFLIKNLTDLSLQFGTNITLFEDKASNYINSTFFIPSITFPEKKLRKIEAGNTFIMQSKDNEEIFLSIGIKWTEYIENTLNIDLSLHRKIGIQFTGYVPGFGFELDVGTIYYKNLNDKFYFYYGLLFFRSYKLLA